MAIINVKDAPYSAAGDGVSDDTQKIQNAIDTGNQIYMPTGTYLVKKMITMKPGQILRGDGRTKSYFRITPDFPNPTTVPLPNPLPTGVLKVGSSATVNAGAEVYDIGFKFDQPDTAINRSTCIPYAPAIDLGGVSRAIIDRVRIENAWDGISATGNAGGCYIGFIEVGALNKAMVIDGAKDFFHGGHWHFWPFGISGTSALNGIYHDGNAVALAIGTVDGLNIDSVSSFAQAITVDSNLAAPLAIHISKLQLDADGSRLLVGSLGLLDSNGNPGQPVLNVGVCYSSKSAASILPTVDVKAGVCVIGSYTCQAGTASNELHTSGGVLIVNGGSLRFDNPKYAIAQSEGGFLSLNNVRFHSATPAQSITHSHVLQVSGALKVRNCEWVPRQATANSSDVCVEYTTDDKQNHCSGNNFGGWAYKGYNIGVLGKYDGNTNDSDGGGLTQDINMDVKQWRLAVSADASGNWTGAHSITDLQKKVVDVIVLYQAVTGEERVGVVNSIDATNISVSCGVLGASRPLRILITFTVATDSR